MYFEISVPVDDVHQFSHVIWPDVFRHLHDGILITSHSKLSETGREIQV